MAGLVHGGAEVQASLRAYLQEHLLGDPAMDAGHAKYAGGRPEARAAYWVSGRVLVAGHAGQAGARAACSLPWPVCVLPTAQATA